MITLPPRYPDNQFPNIIENKLKSIKTILKIAKTFHSIIPTSLIIKKRIQHSEIQFNEHFPPPYESERFSNSTKDKSYRAQNGQWKLSLPTEFRTQPYANRTLKDIQFYTSLIGCSILHKCQINDSIVVKYVCLLTASVAFGVRLRTDNATYSLTLRPTDLARGFGECERELMIRNICWVMEKSVD